MISESMSNFMHSKISVICLHSSHLGFPEDRCMVCVSRISSMISCPFRYDISPFSLPRYKYERNLVTYSDMDGPKDYHTKPSKLERER